MNRRNFLQKSSLAVSALAAGSTPTGLSAANMSQTVQPATRKGPRTDLFLDDEILEMTASVTRRIHQPTKHPLNPIIRPEEWWEGYSTWPVATLYDTDEKLFKMWYRTGPWGRVKPIEGHASYAAYATSTEVHWEKPKLGALKFAGRTDHNI